MVDLNVANFFTVGIISVVFYALFKYIASMVGFNPSWL